MRFLNIKNNLILDRERLILWAPVLFGLGICFYFSLPFEIPVVFPFLIFIAFSFSLFLFRHKPAFFIFLCFWIIIAGFLNIQIQTKIRSSMVNFISYEQTTYLKGLIFKTDFSSKGKPRLWLKNVSDFDVPLKGIYRITANTKDAFQIGDCVETVATLAPPSHPLLVKGFEFDRHAFYQGISAIGYTQSNVYKTDCTSSPTFFTKFQTAVNNLRSNITNHIFKVLKSDTAAIASVLLVGNKNFVSDNLYEQYRNAGLAHFLSISGLHMGIIATFVFFLVRFLMALIPYLSLHYSSKKTACFFAIAFSFIYLLLSGANVPALRAFFMSSLVLVGVLLDREAISMRMLCVAALLILVFEPQMVLSASFELSFAAVLALVAFYEICAKTLCLNGHSFVLRIVSYFVAVFFTALIATLATLPFSLYHFGTLAPYAVLGNLLAAPLIAFLIMPSVFLSLILLPLRLSFYPLKMAGFGIDVLNHITNFISSLPLSNTHFSEMPLWALLMISFGMLWLCLWQQKWRLYGLVFIVAGFLSFAFVSTPDILYSANGQTIGLKTPQNELFIFSKKKNNFLNQVWSQNYKAVQVFKKPQSIPEIDLYCHAQKCTYKNIFEFDLNGRLNINGTPLTPENDLGGAVYLRDHQAKLKTIRQTIGHRPWNK